MKKLRILQICGMESWGGGEAHVYDLSRKLLARGHEVTVACKRRSALEQRLREAQIPILFIPGGLPGVVSISRFLRSRRIQLIHAHAGKDYWPAILSARLSPRSKVVLTRHILPPLKSRSLAALFNRWVDQWIAVSEPVQDALARGSGVDGRKICVIPNALDLTRCRPCSPAGLIRKNWGIPETDSLIGCVGRISEEKGQEDLLLAAPAVLAEWPQAVFVMVGGDSSRGQTELRHLQQMTQELQLGQRVVFTGFRDNVPELISELDMVVIPSRKDAFGLVALEAMAQQRPLVATRAVGLFYEQKDSDFALLVDPRQPGQLAHAILELLKDPLGAKQRGAAGRKALEENYDWETVFSRIEELYCRLVS